MYIRYDFAKVAFLDPLLSRFCTAAFLQEHHGLNHGHGTWAILYSTEATLIKFLIGIYDDNLSWMVLIRNPRTCLMLSITLTALPVLLDSILS